MTSDMLSQEEIDAILKGGSTNEPDLEFEDEDLETDLLSELEVDALGEIGNISMGTAATTLSTLLNKKVNITTPSVSITTADELAEEYKSPFVAVDVSYKEGLKGSNIMILHSDDAKIITDLMLGKEDFDTEREISDMDLSAVSEAMNQMMGSASTSLSEMFSTKIDIEPPVSMEITFDEGKEKIDLLRSKSPIIKVSFRIEIGDLINSKMMQLIPIEFGKDMVDNLMGISYGGDAISEVDTQVEEVLSQEIPDYVGSLTSDERPRDIINEPIKETSYGKSEDKVLVKTPEFNSFTPTQHITSNSSIDLIGDIPVEITVELGRTNRKISDILEFGQGSVIELDKLVGEALNIFANGRFIAKGEVVVIDDSFGVRITDIDNTGKNIL